MLIAFDIGNSDMTIGVNDGGDWRYIWRLPSSKMNEVFYALKIQNFFLEAAIETTAIRGAVISSVVPDVTETIVRVAQTLFQITPVLVAVPLYDRIPVRVLNPYQIGTDLVANAVAAFAHGERGGRDVVVVDFGTALTFTVVSRSGEISGVAILPGLKTAIRSLSQNTAKLFDVPLELPETVLGKNTIHAIQAGLLYGYEGVVDNILKRIRHEVDPGIQVLATGGLCTIVPGLNKQVHHIIPTLTLDGLRLIYEASR